MKLQTKFTVASKRRLGYKLLLLTVLLALSLACGTTSARTLLWSDEFDGTSIDTTKWTIIDAHDWENWQCWYAPHNVEVSGGTLKLHSQEEVYNTGNWTGAKLESKYHPQYKYLEARVRHSAADTNIWSAWWTVGWNGVTWVWPPEFDIFEFVTAWGEYSPFQVYHWTDELRDGGPTGIDETQWHTYGVYWTETETPIFYVDDIISCVPGGPANVSAMAALMILSSSPSEYDHPTGCPLADFEVDYVRVYDTPPEQLVNEDNLALGKDVSASSVQPDTTYYAYKAVDGTLASRWASAWGSEPQWLRVDLGNTYTIDKVKILWQYAYARDYKIQIADSLDGPWTDCISISGNETYYPGTGDPANYWRTHEFAPQTGCYVRVYCTQREYGSIWGYSMFELEVYEQEQQPQECVGYWKLDENDSHYAYDETSNNNDGYIHWPDWTQGKLCSALNFDAEKYNCVSVCNSETLQLIDAITIEAWVKKSSFEGHDESIVSKKQAGGYYLGIGGYSNDYPGKVVAEFRISGTYYSVVSPNDLPLNEWVRLSVTFDGAHMKLYVNGEFVAATPCAGTIDTNTATLFIGMESGGINPEPNHTFAGIIDEVKIYNYARSFWEILADYNNEKDVTSVLMSYWSFDEAGGGTTVYDETGNNNHGTVYGRYADTRSSGWNESLGIYFFMFWRNYVTIPPSASLNITHEITVEAWVLRGPYSYLHNKGSIVGKWLDSWRYGDVSHHCYGLWLDDLKPSFTIHDGVNSVTATFDTELPEYGWHHVVGVFKPGEYIKIYVDGVAQTVPTTISSIQSVSSLIQIGEDDIGTYSFNGTIDEVKIYNGARSAEEILNDYNGL